MEAERAPGTVIDGRYRVVRNDDEGVYAVDCNDGERVLLPHPPQRRHEGAFVDVMFREADARAVAALAHPSIVRVRAVTPRLVIDDPPPIWAPSYAPHTEDLVACALLMLDAMAHLHAAGLSGVSVVPENARFHIDAGRWRLALVHPPLPPIDRFDVVFPVGAARSWDDEVLRDVASIGPLIARHQLREVEAPKRFPPSAWPRPEERPPLLPDAFEALVAMLIGPLHRPGGEAPAVGAIPEGFPRTARDLAEALLPFAPRESRWPALVAAMPRVTEVSVVRDWDALIAIGETEREALAAEFARCGLDARHGAHSPYIVFPLAAAYHARACLALSRGDRSAARADLDRALAIDPSVTHLTTRGLLLAGDGDAAAARASYDAAIGLADDETERMGSLRGHYAALARAHYCRACLRIEQSDPRGALDDLAAATSHLDLFESLHRLRLCDLKAAVFAPSRDWIDRARTAAERRLASV